jgi:hypothetical protein
VPQALLLALRNEGLVVSLRTRVLRSSMPVLYKRFIRWQFDRDFTRAPKAVLLSADMRLDTTKPLVNQCFLL